MPAVAQDGIDRLLADVERVAQYQPHEPFDRQRVFLRCHAIEVLYGGAARGGKSDALLLAALQGVHAAGYAALLLRRTYTDLALPDAIMDRSHAWLSQTDARWSELGTAGVPAKSWTFPNASRIVFGHLDHERDKFRYQGASLQFVGFDELTQFLETQYTYLFSRLTRLAGSEVPMRMRAATNPGGVGHAWVKERFITAPEDRVFVPAFFTDNRFIDRDSYRGTLARLDSITRRQLEFGEWITDESAAVYKFVRSRNLVTTMPVLAEPRTALGIDYGFVDATAFVVLAYDAANERKVYIPHSESHEGMTPSDAARRVRELDATWKFSRIVGDTGGLGKGYAEEARKRFRIPVEAADKQNRRGHQDLLNGALVDGDLLVVRGEANAPLVAEFEALMWNDKRTDAAGGKTHLTDGALYGFIACQPDDSRQGAWRYVADPVDPRSAAQIAAEAEIRRMNAVEAASW